MRKTFRELIPQGFYDEHNGGKDIEGLTRYVNGSEILWMHLKDLNIKALMSLELGFFGISQAEECQPDAYEMLESRLRYIPKFWQQKRFAGRQFPQYGFIECNPNGKDWIYYKFHPNAVDIHGNGPDPNIYAYFFVQTCDNSFRLEGYPYVGKPLVDENTAYYKTLEKKPESWKRRYFYGSREVSEGSWHREFNKHLHCYDPAGFNPFEARKVRAVYGFLDYGVSSPSAYILMAIDSEGCRWFFAEHYGVKATIEDHCAQILRLEERVGQHPSTRFADPSMWHQTRKDSEQAIMAGNMCPADEYQQNGVLLVQADNSEVRSFENIEAGLQRHDEEIHAVTGKPGAPHFYFSYDCPNLVDQTEQQRRKLKRNPITGETLWTGERNEGIEDHAYDCLRYAANWNPNASRSYSGPMARPAMRYAKT